MMYPVCVYVGDEKYAHGVVIPDLPGCFSAADDWHDLPHMISEAVELWFEGEDMELPNPTPLSELVNDPEYTGGVWFLLDLDATTRTVSCMLDVVDLHNR